MLLSYILPTSSDGCSAFYTTLQLYVKWLIFSMGKYGYKDKVPPVFGTMSGILLGQKSPDTTFCHIWTSAKIYMLSVLTSLSVTTASPAYCLRLSKFDCNGYQKGKSASYYIQTCCLLHQPFFRPFFWYGYVVDKTGAGN